MTVSLWRRVALPAVEKAEVVVVGAGVCGLSVGLELAARGVGYVILDRCQPGSGASTRNAGFLMRGAAENYALGVKEYGRELTRTVWRWTEENLALLRAEGLELLSSYSPRASCLLALEETERAELEASIELMREDGFETAWVARGDDAAWAHAKPLGGLLNPRDGVVNPADLMALLASKHRGRIREHQEVCEIEAGAGGVRLRTAERVFEAERVVVCTNAYTGTLLPSLASCVTPRRGQMLAVHAPGVRLEHAYYANRGSEYFRNATADTIVVGGCRTYHADAEVGIEDRTTPIVQGDLERFAERVLGRRYPIVARWAGTMGFSPDGLPLIGAIPGVAGGFFCGGFTGHGMSMARRSARSVVELMLDGTPTPLPLERAMR